MKPTHIDLWALAAHEEEGTVWGLQGIKVLKGHGAWWVWIGTYTEPFLPIQHLQTNRM